MLDFGIKLVAEPLLSCVWGIRSPLCVQNSAILDINGVRQWWIIVTGPREGPVTRNSCGLVIMVTRVIMGPGQWSADSDGAMIMTAHVSWYLKWSTRASAETRGLTGSRKARRVRHPGPGWRLQPSEAGASCPVLSDLTRYSADSLDCWAAAISQKAA